MPSIELSKCIGDRRRDEPPGDRVKRLDHHVLGIVDFVADRGDDDRGDRRGQFPMARDFGAAKRFDEYFRGRRLHPPRVADAILQPFDLRFRRIEAGGFRTEKQGLEFIDFARLSARRRHINWPFGRRSYCEWRRRAG